MRKAAGWGLKVDVVRFQIVTLPNHTDSRERAPPLEAQKKVIRELAALPARTVRGRLAALAPARSIAVAKAASDGNPGFHCPLNVGPSRFAR